MLYISFRQPVETADPRSKCKTVEDEAIFKGEIQACLKCGMHLLSKFTFTSGMIVVIRHSAAYL